MLKRILYRHNHSEDWHLAPVKSLLTSELMDWATKRALAVGRQMDFQIVDMELSGAQFICTGFGTTAPSPKEPSEAEGPKAPSEAEGPKAPSGVEGTKEPLEGRSDAKEERSDPCGQAGKGSDPAGKGGQTLKRSGAMGKGLTPDSKPARPLKSGQRERDDDGAAPVRA